VDSVSLWLAFGAGLLSFISPCVLPLVPTYLSYLTGTSLSEQSAERGAVVRARLWCNALAFIVGFSAIFIAFGLSASALGQLLASHQVLLRRVSGVIIIIFGLHLTGLLKVGWLMRERRFHYTPGESNPSNSLLMGMAFSAGWTPCIGPTLGSILLLASNSATTWQGGYLLAVYSAGLAVPFLAVTLAVRPAVNFLRRRANLLPLFSVLNGVLMIIVGVMVYNNYFSRLSSFFNFNI